MYVSEFRLTQNVRPACGDPHLHVGFVLRRQHKAQVGVQQTASAGEQVTSKAGGAQCEVSCWRTAVPSVGTAFAPHAEKGQRGSRKYW